MDALLEISQKSIQNYLVIISRRNRRYRRNYFSNTNHTNLHEWFYIGVRYISVAGNENKFSYPALNIKPLLRKSSYGLESIKAYCIRSGSGQDIKWARDAIVQSEYKNANLEEAAESGDSNEYITDL